MKRIQACAVLAALTLAAWAQAQKPASKSAPPAQKPAAPAAPAAIPAGQQASREQLARLFEVMRMRQQFKQLTGMMSAAMQQSVHQGIQQAMAQVPAARQLTPEQQTKLNDILDKYMKKAMNVYPPDEMIADATTVYQRHMSRSDVDAYIAFYSSPPGQRFLDAQPVIMKEYMPIVTNKAVERSKALETELLQEISDFVKSQAPQPPPQSPPQPSPQSPPQPNK